MYENINKNQRIFICTFVGTLFFKIYLSIVIPLSGDEALFYVWGQKIQWGFYDHPPMIGWLIWLLSQLDKSLWVIRFPATVLNHLLALGIISQVGLWSPQNRDKAYVMSTIYLLLPISLLSVLITNDIPLNLFCSLSIFYFLKAQFAHEQQSASKDGFLMLSGVFLGCAFLSKYLAVLLILPYAVLLLRDKRWRAGFFLFGSFTPFVALNIIWNIFNCAQNILFNTQLRAGNFVSPLEGASKYIFSLLYIFTPLLLIYLWKSQSELKKYRAICIIAGVPFALYLLLSIKQVIGIHWLPALIPAVILLCALVFDSKKLATLFKWILPFSIVHAALITVLLSMPMHTWEKYPFYHKISMFFYSKEIAQIVNQNIGKNDQIMTLGYATAGYFEYYLGKRIPVFGMGSKYARHDDLNFNFKEMQGKNIRIFDNDPMLSSDYEDYFASVKFNRFEYQGVNYWYVDGESFNYEAYKKGVLSKIANQYYASTVKIPYCQCDFLKKYDLTLAPH